MNITPEEREDLARRIGGRVASLRAFFGLSQAELSRRTKIARPNISRIEKGRYGHLPLIETILVIARAFGCPAALILSVVERTE